MNCFFTLIYCVPNRFSEERIAVGILMNIEGVPFFALSDRKLNFALNGVSAEIKASIRKGFYFLDWDVNKIRRGEETLSLFDPPYAKKILKELVAKKRGLIQYADLIELNKDLKKSDANSMFSTLHEKFIGEPYQPKETKKKGPNFKTRIRQYTTTKKFNLFEKNFLLSANEFPFIYKDMRVDLCRKSNFYTVFFAVDFSASLQTIQGKISQFRLIVQSLQQISMNEGLSSGRYYLVYESTSNNTRLDLINRLKEEANLGFSLIRISEMSDKI